jgi:hypothetical protein
MTPAHITPSQPAHFIAVATASIVTASAGHFIR